MNLSNLKIHALLVSIMLTLIIASSLHAASKIKPVVLVGDAAPDGESIPGRSVPGSSNGRTFPGVMPC